ncbi:MAG: T9SS C-terminal target domain-containing protein, partial [Chlorobiota bacterium]
AGPVPNSNAAKWTQGNEWNNGWTGTGFNVSPVFNLGSSWMVDSMKIKLKCPPGTGALRVQLEGGGGKKGTVFTPVADDQWHSYSFPLREMAFQDNTTFFDSSNVNVVQIMAEATGVAGRVVWITDWWTGNPKFDVIAPPAPQGVAAFAGTYQNVVTWIDVPNETGETYDIFYSKNPITDLTAPGVEVVKLGVAENAQLFEHLLLAPNTNQSTTYYYAVTCKDLAGNKSVVSQNSSAVTNTARGRATVSLSAPANFVADGNLAEWQHITPFRMYISDGTGFVVTNTTVTNDADLSAKAYVAMDNQYMYVAFDVDDDIVVQNAQGSSYLNDAPDLYIGLYNWHGMPHTSYQRGAQPDYHFRFAYNRILIDGSAGTDSLIGEGVNYYWDEKFPSGYIVEAKINLADLALHGNDLTFVPVEGYRLPIDFALNDADATQTREGIMTYSPYNEDKSYQDVSRWLYTWIGNLWEPTDINDPELTPDRFALAQNYPNPFNPSTTIKYAIEKPGFVSLRIYDMLGREVANLVNQDQSAGVYTVKFDATQLASGIYFYKLESGSNSLINKMMLVK